VVLRGQLENPSSSLSRALTAYHRLDLLHLQPRRTVPPAVKTQNRLTDTEIDQAIAGYQAGATLRQLAAQFGVSRHTVGKHLKARGIQLRLSSLTSAEVQEAIRLYRQGLSLARVGERLGRDDSLIHLTLKRAGIQCRDNHGRKRS
jgi:IS30 family transposase